MKPVIIAGGGIGGLTLANCLQRTGIPYLILESAPKFFVAGYALSLGHNAMECLGKINPDLQERIKNVGVETTFTYATAEGKNFYSVEHEGEYAKYGISGFLPMSRQNLQRELLKDIPESSFRVDSRVTSFEQETNQVLVSLSNGKTIEGSLLVGADGIRSNVRNFLHEKYTEELGPPPKVEYTNFSFYGGDTTLSSQADDDLLTDFSCLFAEKRLGIVLPMQVNDSEKRVFWSIGLPMEKPLEQIEKKDADKVFLKELASPFHAKYKFNRMIDTASRYVVWDICHLVRPANYNRWGHGNVTLLGDAAHAVTPWIGQGAGISVEDAYDLTVRLNEYPEDYSKAVESYEKQRIPRAKFIYNLAAQTYTPLSFLMNPNFAPFARLFYKILKWSKLDQKQAGKLIFGYNEPSVPLKPKQQ